MPYVPRMRTADGVLEIIKEQDPESQVTLHYLRGLVRTEKVPVVEAGKKKLVDADAVLRFLSEGDKEPAEIMELPTAIRRVAK